MRLIRRKDSILAWIVLLEIRVRAWWIRVFREEIPGPLFIVSNMFLSHWIFYRGDCNTISSRAHIGDDLFEKELLCPRKSRRWLIRMYFRRE